MLDKDCGTLASRAFCELRRLMILGSRRWLMEQRAAKWKQFSTSPSGKPSKIANPGQAFRQDMLQEAAQEFLTTECHCREAGTSAAPRSKGFFDLCLYTASCCRNTRIRNPAT
jgi:hypothetical protein